MAILSGSFIPFVSLISASDLSSELCCVFPGRTHEVWLSTAITWAPVLTFGTVCIQKVNGFSRKLCCNYLGRGSCYLPWLVWGNTLGSRSSRVGSSRWQRCRAWHPFWHLFCRGKYTGKTLRLHIQKEAGADSKFICCSVVGRKETYLSPNLLPPSSCARLRAKAQQFREGEIKNLWTGAGWGKKELLNRERQIWKCSWDFFLLVLLCPFFFGWC